MPGVEWWPSLASEQTTTEELKAALAGPMNWICFLIDLTLQAKLPPLTLLLPVLDDLWLLDWLYSPPWGLYPSHTCHLHSLLHCWPGEKTAEETQFKQGSRPWWCQPQSAKRLRPSTVWSSSPCLWCEPKTPEGPYTVEDALPRPCAQDTKA